MKKKPLKFLAAAFLIAIAFIIVFYFYWNHEQKIPNYPQVTSLSLKKTGMKGSKFIVSCQEIDENSMKDAMSYLSSNHPDGWFRVNPFINSIPSYYIYINDSGSKIHISNNRLTLTFYENGQKIPLAKFIETDGIHKFINLFCSKENL